MVLKHIESIFTPGQAESLRQILYEAELRSFSQKWDELTGYQGKETTFTSINVHFTAKFPFHS